MVRRIRAEIQKNLIMANNFQSIGDRIRWIRIHQKPYMTMQQLAYLCRTHVRRIDMVENNRIGNSLRFDTLRRMANALGCQVYITIRKRPSRGKAECQLLGPELMKPPKRKGRTSAQARVLVARLDSSYMKINRHGAYRLRRKATSGKRGSRKQREEETAE